MLHAHLAFVFSVILAYASASTHIKRNVELAMDSDWEKMTVPEYCFNEEKGDDEDSNENGERRSYFQDNSTTTPGDINEEASNGTQNGSNPDLSRFSEDFLSCAQFMIEEGCYHVLPNGSVYISTYKKVLNESDFNINKGLYICSHHAEQRNTKNFSQTSAIVTKVGLGISIACILMHMVMFALVPTMRNLPGYCLISLCVALLIAYLCFVVRDFLEYSQPCFHIGMLMVYFFLASFFWMNVLAFDIWRSLRMATSKLRLVTRMNLRLCMYSLYAWGSSLLIVVIALIIDNLDYVPENYKLEFSVKYCWFSNKHATLVYFALPLFSMLFLNLVFFVLSFIMITRASMKSVENRNDLWTRLCIFMRLFIIMGLTWIFGVLGAATNIEFFWYLFVLLNSFKGVLIFFSFTFGEKVKKAWNARFRKRKTSATNTQSSFQSQHQTTAV